MKIVLVVLLLIVLILFALQLRAAQVTPQVGALAPDFTLPDQQGTPRKLSDYRGKWVVLYFYPKDETPAAPRKPAPFATIGSSSRP